MSWYACEKCGGAGWTGWLWWAKTCSECNGDGHYRPPLQLSRPVPLPPPPPRMKSTCTKCGRDKPRMDSSPCGQCVSELVAETRELVRKVTGREPKF